MTIHFEPGGIWRASFAGLAALVMSSGLALAQDYNEAPMLADQVAAGSLPPVAERLPENPIVVTPFESVGQYGGTWRLVMNSPSDINTLVRTIGYENFTRWENWQPGNEQADIVPNVEMNVAESIEANEDGSVYTVHLREGLKWSDGEPYTADDVMFWYEDVYSNTELFPSKPTWSVRGGQPVVLEKVDDYTVTFTFGGPHGLLLQYWATPANDVEPNQPTAYPRHYMEQFHPKYNADAAAQANGGRRGSAITAAIVRQPGRAARPDRVAGQGDGAPSSPAQPTISSTRRDQLPISQGPSTSSPHLSPCSRRRAAISTRCSISASHHAEKGTSSTTRRRAATTSTRCCPTAPTS